LRRTSVVQFADGNRKGAREGPKKQQSLSFDYRHSRILAAGVVLSVAAAGNSINLDNSATVGSLPFGVNVLTITGIPCDSMLSWTRIFHFMRFCVFCVHHPSPALLQASVGTHSDSSPKDRSQAPGSARSFQGSAIPRAGVKKPIYACGFGSRGLAFASCAQSRGWA